MQMAALHLVAVMNESFTQWEHSTCSRALTVAPYAELHAPGL